MALNEKQKKKLKIEEKLNEETNSGEDSFDLNKTLKIIVLNLVLILAAMVFGFVCSKIYYQYKTVFSPGPALLNLGYWLLAAFIIIFTAIGLFTALVRPFWAVALGFALSGLAMILIWQINTVTLLLALFYFLMAIAYGRSVIKELEARLDFSLHPIAEKQKALLFPLVILLSASFALAYYDNVLVKGLVLPPEYKEKIISLEMGYVEAGINKQPNVKPADKKTALEQSRAQFEQIFSDTEKKIQPSAKYVAVGIAFIIFTILLSLLGLLLFLPNLLLRLMFFLLKLSGIAKIVTEQREAKRLTL